MHRKSDGYRVADTEIGRIAERICQSPRTFRLIGMDPRRAAGEIDFRPSEPQDVGLSQSRCRRKPRELSLMR